MLCERMSGNVLVEIVLVVDVVVVDVVVVVVVVLVVVVVVVVQNLDWRDCRVSSKLEPFPSHFVKFAFCKVLKSSTNRAECGTFSGHIQLLVRRIEICSIFLKKVLQSPSSL